MIKYLVGKIFGTWHEKYLKQLKPVLDRINSLEPQYQIMSDTELLNTTAILKERLEKGETLDDISYDAFAAVREVSHRVLNMRHYDVQLIGGYVLHKGLIAEMRTGEGKTLVATLPLYLNSLTGKGVHLVTVNDYLAKRDAVWMAPIYLSLGVSVGIIQNERSYRAEWSSPEHKEVICIEVPPAEAYACDITYGTNNEFGFDYLRDNMKYQTGDFVQRPLNYAIVDEVDSILIDEARTPLIISGPTDENTNKYYIINNVVKNLKKGVHYTVDEKARNAILNDEGINYVESSLGIENLYDISNVDTLHFVNNALKAHAIFKLDVDYMVVDNQILIVDEFTGRTMHGRRFSDGLHQALEAKENVTIQNENQTLASITFQNYFRMYNKLAGMTGTAITESEEFLQIYSLSVVPIPTHRPVARIDNSDVIYRTAEEKYTAIVAEIQRLHKKGQPVLVGTISVEQSEYLSSRLSKLKIPHEVLNAKNHEREASIVEQAGQKGAVTIATNMAGRGTDIKLGQGVIELGGLYILGTERHESRRIDNQLRGRSGRQGDPGESKFFISIEDDLMRVFGGDKIGVVMDKLGMKEGENIENPIISKAIQSAQKRVENMHFEVRKHLLEYDDVANKQRQIIYDLRKKVLIGEVDNVLSGFIAYIAQDLVSNFMGDPTTLREELKNLCGVDAQDITGKGSDEEIITRVLTNRLEERKAELGDHYPNLSLFLTINVIDAGWKEHLLQMDYLRDSVGLRGYGQKDPLIEFKRESFAVFTDMYGKVQYDVIKMLMFVMIRNEADIDSSTKKASSNKIKEERRDIFSQSSSSPSNEKSRPVRRGAPKIGRNELCFCGSGKKYKNCHGASK